MEITITNTVKENKSFVIGYSDYIVFGKSFIDKIITLTNFGTKHIEISLEDTNIEEIYNKFLKIEKQINDHTLKFTVHPKVSGINIASLDKECRLKSIQAIKEAIDLAIKLHAKYVVIHPGYINNNHNLENIINIAKQSIIELNEYTKKKVFLAIENVGNLKTSLFTQETYLKFINSFETDNIYALIDTGHANICKWNIPNLIYDLNDKLIGIHINDNWGIKDEHLSLGKGNINWIDIINALKKQKHYINLTLEYNPNVSLNELKETKNFIMNYLN